MTYLFYLLTNQLNFYSSFIVLQVSVKLFLFDKQTQTWLEKGRGLLRLNDKLSDGSNTNRSFQSRLGKFSIKF